MEYIYDLHSVVATYTMRGAGPTLWLLHPHSYWQGYHYQTGWQGVWLVQAILKGTWTTWACLWTSMQEQAMGFRRSMLNQGTAHCGQLVPSCWLPAMLYQVLSPRAWHISWAWPRIERTLQLVSANKCVVSDCAMRDGVKHRLLCLLLMGFSDVTCVACVYAPMGRLMAR